MSLLEILQLIGYSFGAALHLWLGTLLTGQRTKLSRIERVLLALAFSMGLWHASNLIITLHSLLGLSASQWVVPILLTESLAVISITVCYSLLLHVHLHLWANARERALTFTERARVYLSYVPLVFLVFAVPAVWNNVDGSMLDKLTRVEIFGVSWNFVVAFAYWAAYVLALVGTTDLLIARQAKTRGERVFMATLAISFFSIAGLILLVHGAGVGAGTSVGAYLQTLANLGSLLPTALLAYYIYRYRYLELIIRNSLVVALFAVVVLVVYLYGIRALGEFLTARYALRPGVIESLLILALALVAAPLRGWLERRFNKLFDRETALYRDVLEKIGMLSRDAWRYKQLPELLGFVAERTEQTLGLTRVRFLVTKRRVTEADAMYEPAASNGHDAEAALTIELVRRIGDALMLEDDALLDANGWQVAYALRREAEVFGVMLVDAPRERLTNEVRQAAAVIAGQVALAIADCRLVEENIELYARIARGERLSALGQMAATVAHEIKNPLSAIKSIAQVMREDERLSDGYSRDLELIVGETDRLSRSVTQLLNWTRDAPAIDAPCAPDDLVSAALRLFRHEAERGDIEIEHCAGASNVKLDGRRAAALRDALSNLLLNALQATPPKGRVIIETEGRAGELIVRVADGGAGVAPDLRERIWEPFFTTKQRGTGLGLSIVRKRIREVGGDATLSATSTNAGACFELRLPFATR